jgi:hypothetical protein
MPVNNKLKAIAVVHADPTGRALIEKWGRLHAGRTALGLAATLVYFSAGLAGL